jgi:hypothetical protein
MSGGDRCERVGDVAHELDGIIIAVKILVVGNGKIRDLLQHGSG